MNYTSIQCVGLHFRPDETKQVIAAMAQSKAPAIVTFEPDPENEFDKHAIKIHLNGIFAGFVPKLENQAFLEFLKQESFVPIATARVMMQGSRANIQITIHPKKAHAKQT